jgi:hypothetical protein
MASTEGVLRLAMWSGPRNISTAMMRSWGNRTDTVVEDEPFYAHYLQVTGLDHPGRDEVIAHHETNWESVAARMTGAPLPSGMRIHYQKHMAHHLLPHMGREWLDGVMHAFLIRDPRPMVASLQVKLGDFDLLATGLPQQVEIFEHVRRRSGKVPPVIDAADVQRNPEAALRALCEALGVEFSSRMLRWPPGRRATDGIWASHWYERVERSTGFEPLAETAEPPLQEPFATIEESCRPLYEQLRPHRLRID